MRDETKNGYEGDYTVSSITGNTLSTLFPHFKMAANKSSRNRDVTASSPLDLPQNECPPKPTLTAVNPDWANANQANPNLNPYQAHLNPKKANPKKLQCQAGGKGGGGGGA